MPREITHALGDVSITIRVLINRDRRKLLRIYGVLADLLDSGDELVSHLNETLLWDFAYLCCQWVSAEGEAWDGWQPPNGNATKEQIIEAFTVWDALPLKTGTCASAAMQALARPADPDLVADVNESADPKGSKKSGKRKAKSG